MPPLPGMRVASMMSGDCLVLLSDIDGLYTVLSLPDISQVYMLYRATLTDLNFAAGTESLEVALFTEQEIPWDELAFRTISTTLRHYFADRVSGKFPIRSETLRHPSPPVSPPPARKVNS